MEMSIRFPGIDLFLNYVPRSFWIFGMEFTIYGILIAIGALLGMGLVTLEAKRNGEDQNRYLDMMIISLLFSVIGSRLFYVIFSWELYKENLNGILDFRNGGYAFYGGLLFGFLAAAVFCRITKISFWQAADAASLGILLGQIIGRWGNFFNRESFGEYADLPWAMQIPVSAVRSGEVSGTMRDKLLTIDGISYIQVQPVFLYESLWCLVLLLLLLAMRRKKKYEGELFMIYLSGYGLGRFFFEWFRTDKLCIPGTKVGISLVISAVLFAVFTPVVVIRRVMAQKRAAIRSQRRKRFLNETGEGSETASDAPDIKTEAESEIQPEYDRQNGKETLTKNSSQEKMNQETEAVRQSEAEKTSEKKIKDVDRTEAEERETTDSEENVNWENSEYAHIPEKWRQHVGDSPTNLKDDL